MDYWNTFSLISFSDIKGTIVKETLIGILGAGKSGVACSQLALAFGYKVILSEISKDKKINLDSHDNLEIERGVHSKKLLSCNLIVISPGIPLTIKIVKEAIKRGISVIGEIEFASWFTKSDILAVTGSNGKSTTCMMLHQILLDGGYNSLLGGNIGVPFSNNLLAEMNSEDKNTVHVLELSSFQIESLKKFKSTISCILNISEDHLDRYKNMDLYIEAKLKIINLSDSVLFDDCDEILYERIKKTDKIKEINSDTSLFKIVGSSIYNNKTKQNMFSLKDTNFIGHHNLLNALGACTIASLYGVDDESIIKTMKNIHPLNHRLELIADVNSIKFYNDSKSTNIKSTLKALESFDGNVILILGGINKGSDFSNLGQGLGIVKNIYSYGQSGEEIKDSLKSIKHVNYISNFSDCIKEVIKNVGCNDNILLSPGCASFDQFNNFEERGDLFKKIIREAYYV